MSISDGSDGLTDGLADGDMLIPALGLALGDNDTDLDGESDGDFDGLRLIETLGLALGETENDRLGD